MVAILVNILLRQARAANAANPRDWLIALQTSHWTTTNTQGGQITSSSVNGKSVSLTVLPGMSTAHILAATEMAIKALEMGLTHYPTAQTAKAR